MSLPSDEVAEDYKTSLEDLTSNDRFQISNLTVIAKENTEHAMAISRVLENHIRTTPPSQKLPSLYVVDSIVKNVGTPYTLFLGRNMYQTFMNAYTLVDSPTRRKLDEMLKTWKEPVPGSLDTRPVFAPEITRSIENALIKARTAALQQQQGKGQQEAMSRVRGIAAHPSWSSTPTFQGTPRPLPSFSSGNGNPTGFQNFPQHEVDTGGLNRDIAGLISAARTEFAGNPLDPSIQQRLRALLDLQGILQRQELTPGQLKLVRDQVSALGPMPTPVLPSLPPAPSDPAMTPISNLAQPYQHLLNQGTLAELIKATAVHQQPTPPPPTAILPSNPPRNNTPQPVTLGPENTLIASLKARGLLPDVSSSSTPVMPQSLASVLPLVFPNQTQVPSVHVQEPSIGIEVPMSTASVKIPRHALISSLYEVRANRCGTCGRRFFATDEDKERKASHLDWHFKTNQRMAEAAKRAQNRSWYVDERDWIKSREYVDDDSVTAAEGINGGQQALDKEAEKGPEKQWIRAPNDATLRNTPCPVCQERFESTWSEEVQDWIWQDATKAGSRVFHGTCYAEVTKDGRGDMLGRTGSPDSVLGKRKAEDSRDSPEGSSRSRAKLM